MRSCTPWRKVCQMCIRILLMDIEWREAPCARNCENTLRLQYNQGNQASYTPLFVIFFTVEFSVFVLFESQSSSSSSTEPYLHLLLSNVFFHSTHSCYSFHISLSFLCASKLKAKVNWMSQISNILPIANKTDISFLIVHCSTLLLPQSILKL